MIATRVMPALYLTRRVASITPVTTRQPTLPGPWGWVVDAAAHRQASAGP